MTRPALFARFFLTGHFRVDFCPPFVSKKTNETEFHLEVYFHANKTNFYMKDFAREVVVKQRHKETRKWPHRLF